MCQGKKLKEAALLALSMCKTGTIRWSSVGPCRLWKTSLGGVSCVACSCGLVCTWVSGGAVMVPSSWSISWTEMTDNDMESARRGVFTSLRLPLPQATATATPSVPRQLLNYNHVLGVLEHEASLMIDSVAHERVDVTEALEFAPDYFKGVTSWG